MPDDILRVSLTGDEARALAIALLRIGGPPNVAAIAKKLGRSRTWLYTDPAFCREVYLARAAAKAVG